MSIPYEGDHILLRGELASNPTDTIIQVILVEECEASEEQAIKLPPDIMELPQEFNSLFEEPKDLPPSRGYDHSIPLVPGATPAGVRRYRYPPALKDEIEKQVDEMLKLDVIQKNSSKFSSPVLLVKKKDKTWRFCVDYRYLNALTVKGKYRVPIFEELIGHDQMVQQTGP